MKVGFKLWGDWSDFTVIPTIEIWPRGVYFDWMKGCLSINFGRPVIPYSSKIFKICLMPTIVYRNLGVYGKEVYVKWMHLYKPIIKW